MYKKVGIGAGGVRIPEGGLRVLEWEVRIPEGGVRVLEWEVRVPEWGVRVLIARIKQIAPWWFEIPRLSPVAALGVPVTPTHTESYIQHASQIQAS